MVCSERKIQRLLANVSQQLQSSCITSFENFRRNEPLGLSVPVTPLSQAQSARPSATTTRDLTISCLNAAQKLRDACVASGRVDYEQADLRSFDSVWEAAHARQTRSWADAAFIRIRDAVTEANLPNATISTDASRKPVFNHEYTPLLEKYFEYNAYPSAPDRAVLARKCMMMPRQIEVWFQNHRNRAKKEGKTIRRMTEGPLPLELSFQSLDETMPFFTIPEKDRRSSNINSPTPDDLSHEDTMAPSSLLSCSPTVDALNPARPSYAFPSVYMRREFDIFAIEPSLCNFSSPVWDRRPASPTPSHRPRVDMDELAFEFNQKLHLRGPAVNKRSKSLQSWCASRIVVPSVAPHPALIQSNRVAPTLLAPNCKVATLPCAFRSSRPLMPLQTSHQIPKHLSEMCGPHPAANVSLPPSQPSSLPSSRTPSFSQSRQRSVSSSSSSSSLSSVPTTPIILHTSLPEQLPLVSTHHSGSDSDDCLSDGINVSRPKTVKSFHEGHDKVLVKTTPLKSTLLHF